MTTDAPALTHPKISRAELYWLVAAIVFGSILRLGYPGRIAIEHFDEGVYASNIWFDTENGYSYPARYLYAPPLLPAAIEWTIVAFQLIGIRPNGFIPMLPCLIAGIATIPSVWWIGRRWFSPVAGIFVAWLVATSDFHASYSRAALTDVPVCLFILWAVHFIANAFAALNYAGVQATSGSTKKGRPGKDRDSVSFPWRDVVMAGLFTGLAWWTKYNGWLPLAIGLAGGGLWQLLTQSSERRIFAVLRCWLIIAAVSAVIWSPVVWGLQSHGGYAAVAANHRQYVVGLAGWANSELLQAEHVGMYDNWLGLLTEFTGMSDQESARFDRDWSVEELANDTHSSDRERLKRASTKYFIIATRVASYAMPILLLIVSALAIRMAFRVPKLAANRIAICLLSAWLVGMTVATPMYYPYPRLVMPWLFATWIGCGLAVHLWHHRTAGAIDSLGLLPARLWWPTRVECVLIVYLMTNSVIRSYNGTAHAWQDRSGLQSVARQIADQIQQKLESEPRADKGAIVYVWGEPALVYNLRANGLPYVAPVQDLSFVGKPQPLPTYIVYGKHAFDSRQFADNSGYVARCRLFQIYESRPSHLVNLDSQNRDHVDTGRLTAADVWLYAAPK